jgi:tetratricopeptide (TPR) repeat protein
VNCKSAIDHGQCLSEECLTDYLEGTLDPVVRSACEGHLVSCDGCRANLVLFMRVLQEGTTPEEDARLAELSAIWEQKKLRPVPVPRRWAVSRKQGIYAFAGVAALVLAAVALGWLQSRSALSRPTQIVQALVSTIRPFEPRIVGQPYLKIQEITRSAGNLVPDALASEMTESSAESYEVGRYFLLQREYTKAIKYLKIAVIDPKGVPSDVHNDLGVAYLESKDFELAEAEFKAALRRTPGHEPALFNLSILYERQGKFDLALQRSQQYLEVDPDSGWAKELQKKLLRKDSTEP